MWTTTGGGVGRSCPSTGRPPVKILSKYFVFRTPMTPLHVHDRPNCKICCVSDRFGRLRAIPVQTFVDGEGGGLAFKRTMLDKWGGSKKSVSGLTSFMDDP